MLICLFGLNFLQALPEKEKERFEKMAKEYKKKMRGAEGDKFRMDNVGNNLAVSSVNS